MVILRFRLVPKISANTRKVPTHNHFDGPKGMVVAVVTMVNTGIPLPIVELLLQNADFVLCYDGTIVTRDTHFSEVTGLEVIKY